MGSSPVRSAVKSSIYVALRSSDLGIFYWFSNVPLIHTWGAPRVIDDTQLRGLARAVRRGRLGQRQPDALGDALTDSGQRRIDRVAIDRVHDRVLCACPMTRETLKAASPLTLASLTKVQRSGSAAHQVSEGGHQLQGDSARGIASGPGGCAARGRS